jgi:K+-sensing histidine kinase KdpD
MPRNWQLRLKPTIGCFYNLFPIVNDRGEEVCMLDSLSKLNLPKWAWTLLSFTVVATIGYLDFITGDELNLYVFYFLPVVIAAWFIGRGAAITLSVLSVIAWFLVDYQSGHKFSSHFFAVWDVVFRLVAFFIIGWSLSMLRQMFDQERNLVKDLRIALSEVKLLESFLSVCCQCKKIRNDDGSWQPIDSYIAAHTDTKISHGYCPECSRKVMKILRETEG